MSTNKLKAPEYPVLPIILHSMTICNINTDKITIAITTVHNMPRAIIAPNAPSDSVEEYELPYVEDLDKISKRFQNKFPSF